MKSSAIGERGEYLFVLPSPLHSSAVASRSRAFIDHLLCSISLSFHRPPSLTVERPHPRPNRSEGKRRDCLSARAIAALAWA